MQNCIKCFHPVSPNEVYLIVKGRLDLSGGFHSGFVGRTGSFSEKYYLCSQCFNAVLTKPNVAISKEEK